MQPCMNRQQKQIACQPQTLDDTAHGSILELLYDCYTESDPVPFERVKSHYEAFSSAISSLSLEEKKRAYDAICRLCSEHERNAFLEGIRMGVCLIREPDA